MKKIISCFTLLIILGCSSNDKEIDGFWLIHSMTYKGKDVYPTDRTPNKLSLSVPGYEDLKTIEFQIDDSTLIVPGFYSEELPLKYRFKNRDSLTIFYDKDLLNNVKTRFLNYQYQDTVLLSLSNKRKDIHELKNKLDSIKNSLLVKRGSASNQYNMTKDIFCGTYKATVFAKETRIMLKSANTEILLLNENYLSKKRIDKLFEHL